MHCRSTGKFMGKFNWHSSVTLLDSFVPLTQHQHGSCVAPQISPEGSRGVHRGKTQRAWPPLSPDNWLLLSTNYGSPGQCIYLTKARCRCLGVKTSKNATCFKSSPGHEEPGITTRPKPMLADAQVIVYQSPPACRGTWLTNKPFSTSMT